MNLLTARSETTEEAIITFRVVQGVESNSSKQSMLLQDIPMNMTTTILPLAPGRC